MSSSDKPFSLERKWPTSFTRTEKPKLQRNANIPSYLLLKLFPLEASPKDTELLQSFYKSLRRPSQHDSLTELTEEEENQLKAGGSNKIDFEILNKILSQEDPWSCFRTIVPQKRRSFEGVISIPDDTLRQWINNPAPRKRTRKTPVDFRGTYRSHCPHVTNPLLIKCLEKGWEWPPAKLKRLLEPIPDEDEL
ncbi:hypothetical protein RCL1_008000 [Eukaryota sp. TZLM3-RCL]